jgi:hypothetical protein
MLRAAGREDLARRAEAIVSEDGQVLERLRAERAKPPKRKKAPSAGEADGANRGESR